MACEKSMSALETYIAARGMTVHEALKKSGISAATFGILLDGGVTLPCLALAVGRGLKLTQEEVRALGKPIDPAPFVREDLPYRREDAREDWYMSLEQEREATYLSGKPVALWGLEHGMSSIAEVMRQSAKLTSVGQVNGLKRENRMKRIRQLAAWMGVDERELLVADREEGRWQMRWRIDPDKLRALLDARGMTLRELSETVYKDGSCHAKRHMDKVGLEGGMIPILAADRAAAVLGVERKAFGETEAEYYDMRANGRG